MPEPIKGLHIKNTSLSTFQDLDSKKSNFTTGGVTVAHKSINGLSAYVGFGTNFKENTTGGVIDLKGSWQYASIPLSNGKEMTISAGFRDRNKVSPSSQLLQLRCEPCKIKVPLGDNVFTYLSPYFQTQSEYQNISLENLKNNSKAGVMAGFTFKSNNWEISPEYQIYDLTNLSNASGNLIISYNF